MSFHFHFALTHIFPEYVFFFDTHEPKNAPKAHFPTYQYNAPSMNCHYSNKRIFYFALNLDGTLVAAMMHLNETRLSQYFLGWVSCCLVEKPLRMMKNEHEEREAAQLREEKSNQSVPLLRTNSSTSSQRNQARAKRFSLIETMGQNLSGTGHHRDNGRKQSRDMSSSSRTRSTQPRKLARQNSCS